MADSVAGTNAPDGSVLVVGAGIGGLTLALALARRGIATTILERRTVLAEAGAGIQLSPNASRVLIALGLGPALLRRAVEPDALVIRSLTRGRVIASMPLKPAMRERYGAPYAVVHRADLHTILLDAVRGSGAVKLLLGRRVVAGETRDARAILTAETERGEREVYEAPLAVGADGLWSVLRKVLGDERAPDFRNYAAWRATIPASEAPASLAKAETGLWLGAGHHAVHYPIAAGSAFNIVAVDRSAEPLPDWSAQGERELLLRRFGAAAEPLRSLMRAAQDWRVWSLYDLPADQRWQKGRIALLGDAAHPVLPFLAQGGALAIEDACVLADALAAMPDRIEDALARYEQSRRPRAKRVQEAGRRNARLYHLPWPLSLGRDGVLHTLSGQRMMERYDWLYGWRPAT